MINFLTYEKCILPKTHTRNQRFAQNEISVIMHTHTYTHSYKHSYKTHIVKKTTFKGVKIKMKT